MSDNEGLSVCCGEPPLHPTQDNIGVCSRCKDNTTFSHEVAFEDQYYEETGYKALGYKSGGMHNPTAGYVAWLIGIIAERDEALLLACNDIWANNGGLGMPVTLINHYNEKAKETK